MLDKLTSFGMNRSAVQWLRSYLTMLIQSVCTNGVLSETQLISLRVPQGSLLCFSLFIFYINDLPPIIRGCSVELYADLYSYLFCKQSQSVKIKLS